MLLCLNEFKKMRCEGFDKDGQAGLHVTVQILAKPNRKTRRAATSRRWNKKLCKVLSWACNKPIVKVTLILPQRRADKETS